ncbi:pca operon transcription factor PcaQ [Bordetella hinzii]|uniref:Pca operon transcription factor PcaQ n=1 Tax=Bordetella hinzii OH87 BAL007II TaxID=1331262 RepID=A0ABR4R788_9BORD|nr:pca operon transcription factor PcaQ [Bordetella hinzii]KCB26226.1 pca operon transcription factor PcaQ [Bordetella hinzii OH87 BAL007II]KCB41295.1 pca operon transcription factor PcaQ [Bordetella hinzii 5132]QDJ40570.1 pca operon transcription factor PcaQ [Bordetella hinzii]QDJ45129.1 pca operon transcription factor PcaQ [Bordetella hinzii]QDJ54041.1 pca operon transcription factor PcaQ [Bordetella hinzii]
MDKRRVKLRHIECFLAVAQLGSLQRAAESLSITQPAVSKTLSELEEVVGSELFERGRQGAALTAAGRRFAPYARGCLGSLHEGLADLGGLNANPPTVVRVGALPTVASVLLPPALRVFGQEWPTATLAVSTGRNSELLDALKAAELDFIIGRMAEPKAMAGMVFEHLFREPLTVVVRPGHPALAGPQALAGHPLLMPPAGTLIRQSADSLIASWGILAQPGRVESLSVSLNLALTLGNDAVWFVPFSLVETLLAQRRVVALPFAGPGTDEPVGLLRRTDVALGAAASRLFEAVRASGLERERLRLARG